MIVYFSLNGLRLDDLQITSTLERQKKKFHKELHKLDHEYHLMNEHGTSHFEDFFLFLGVFIIYTVTLCNFNKVSVNVGSKKNSIFIRES